MLLSYLNMLDYGLTKSLLLILPIQLSCPGYRQELPNKEGTAIITE